MLCNTNAELVSIVIPCYCGARYLGEAIASCLNQTYRAVEVIVVDDASPDCSLEVARRFAEYDDRVRIVRHDHNRGVAAAFNSGFNACRGAFMARLAQDDRFRRDAIHVMKECLERRQDVGLVCCDMQIIDERSRIVGRREVSATTDGIFEGRIGLCLMWRRAVWERIGVFDSTFDSAEDYEFVLRVLRQFKVCKAGDDAPFYFRMHDQMGSRRFLLRQQLAIHRARARYCGSAIGALRHLSEGFFEASYLRRMERRFLSATRYSASAIACWPFSIRNYRSLAGVGKDLIRHTVAAIL